MCSCFLLLLSFLIRCSNAKDGMDFLNQKNVPLPSVSRSNRYVRSFVLLVSLNLISKRVAQWPHSLYSRLGTPSAQVNGYFTARANLCTSAKPKYANRAYESRILNQLSFELKMWKYKSESNLHHTMIHESRIMKYSQTIPNNRGSSKCFVDFAHLQGDFSYLQAYDV